MYIICWCMGGSKKLQEWITYRPASRVDLGYIHIILCTIRRFYSLKNRKQNVLSIVKVCILPIDAWHIIFTRI